ncbi:MAG: helix-turn-helix domain-containing protein [Dokdonella sp.]
MIRFGSWSTTLALGALFGLMVALLLCCTPRNRCANRLLAALIVLIVLKLGPYILGFAGYYDVYPWLSFAPFTVGLAFGPLLYLHVKRLTSSTMPRGWAWHLLPGALQFGYRAVMFAQPIAVKNAWNASIHERWIDPAETVLEIMSMALYLWLALRAYRHYQRWLDGHVGNREDYRIEWLRNMLLLFVLALPMWAIYETTSALDAFNYYQRFPLYVGFCTLIVILGLEGWRHADSRYPVPTDVVEPAMPAVDALPPTPSDTPMRDWQAQGQLWLDRTAAEGCWRDPDLGLDRLARLLGTNTAYLSRALNEGLGLSFNAAINRLRVADVEHQLTDPNADGDVLGIAFAAGFSSKTSFNRVFKAQTGLTPTQFRAKSMALRPKQ